jgi:hypothetical protein
VLHLNDSVFGTVEYWQSFHVALISYLCAAFSPAFPEETSIIIYVKLESISTSFAFREASNFSRLVYCIKQKIFSDK